MLLAEPTFEPSPSTCPETTTPFNKNLNSGSVAAPLAVSAKVLAFADAVTPVFAAMALMALAFEMALPELRATETPSEVVAPTL